MLSSVCSSITIPCCHTLPRACPGTTLSIRHRQPDAIAKISLSEPLSETVFTANSGRWMCPTKWDLSIFCKMEFTVSPDLPRTRCPWVTTMGPRSRKLLGYPPKYSIPRLSSPKSVESEPIDSRLTLTRLASDAR